LGVARQATSVLNAAITRGHTGATGETEI
jgi:hypothetical protein